MSVDRYTKGVLTVIAVALCVFALQNAIRPAGAQFSVQRVTICDPNGSNCASVTGGSMPGGTWQSPALVVSTR